MLNVSITTNRTCTLKCNHCYIEPELFLSKEQITMDNYKKVFDQVEALARKDVRLKNIEWEVIGGETTMMPFEFWEEMLPYSLKRIEEINKLCEKKGCLNFLTNLIYKDKRYTELFNKYGQHELFCLYTSYEPDTNRFGNNDKLLPRFKKVLGSINAREKILDLILTKTLVAMDPEDIIAEWGALGVTDYSIKQLSPYGSGKEFFKHNMVEFDVMADFLLRFEKARLKLSNRDDATFTPLEEMLGAFSHGSAFQCNGNFKYDLSIEPDGHTHFNANQTMGDMAVGFESIYIDVEDWAERVIFENTIEESRKLTLKHEACNQCEYLKYCNGGWYHYKLLDSEEYNKFSATECAGFKRVWDMAKEYGYHYDQGQLNHLSALTKMSDNVVNETGGVYQETVSNGYQQFITSSSSAKKVNMIVGGVFGKNVRERCFYYESLGIPYKLPPLNLMSPDLDLINHVYSGVLPNADFSHAELWLVVLENKEQTDMAQLVFCYNELAEMFHEEPIITESEHSFVMVLDRRNEEVFRSIIKNCFLNKLENYFEYIDGVNSIFLQALVKRLYLESSVSGDFSL